MPFRVTARTILQLGAELISSDALAFYELIKNAFDASSPRVDIDVNIRLPHDRYLAHIVSILNEQQVCRPKEALKEMREAVVKDIDFDAPEAKKLKAAIEDADDWDKLLAALDSANSIVFEDTGTGMSSEDLEKVFLTIGTRNRLVQVEARGQGKQAGKPVLGEKGIGRLSVMRLGSHVRIRTSIEGESNWNLLDIDWRLFTHKSDAEIGEIDVAPTKGASKTSSDEHGTRIWVTGLSSEWSFEKLKDIARDEFSKLTDPFVPKARYPISLRFNDRAVDIPRMEKLLFEHAHAFVHANYTLGTSGPEFSGKVEYLIRKREKSFLLDVADLTTMTKRSVAALRSLGPFSVTLYWFNRQALEAVEGIGDKRAVQNLVNEWSGGLMVFRDGFRVNPYGSPDDDWLDLDRKALASGGYKVNRKQVVGKVDITRFGNPALTDQTNREGLRDCEEKTVLVRLLKHLFEVQFRAFLNTVDKEAQAALPVSFDDLSDRVESEERQIRQRVQTLLEKHPEIREEDSELVDALEESIERVSGLMVEANELAKSFATGRRELVSLAGLGLMVDIVAHELNRATSHALSTLAETDASDLAPGVCERLETLKAQLKTLQKRLRILDPLSQAGRQVKETFDLIALIEDVVATHEAQFKRHHIACNVTVVPQKTPGSMSVKMVKGMVVQILENLFSNSVYWLKEQQKLEKGFRPKIDVVVDTRVREVRVTDNGPGIPPSRRDEVFQAFVTTKPPGEGKGLGLFISREIAGYHDATLMLADQPAPRKGRLNTFVLTLGVKK
jgi:signal transduction histidine kinase